MLRSSDTRAQSDSEKWHKYTGTNILPMWIADTEFLAAPPILDAPRDRLDHGVFGYGYRQPRFLNAVKKHCHDRYGWHIEDDWILPLTGVVPGLNFSRAISQLHGKNRAVLVEPVYPHLRKHPALLPGFSDSGSPCKLENGRWVPDFDALEANINDDTGLLLLCHPHNPIGRAHTDDELARYSSIAEKYDLIVCADEIHCDLILNGSRHRPFASLGDDQRSRTITLMAASKTWNIAGLSCAFAIIANPELRRDFQRVSAGMTGDVNVLGMTATIAALEHGEPWRQEMLKYLRENAELTEARINATGKLHMTPVENPQKYFEQHGVGMNDGADFGAPGYVRLNFGCPRDMLEEALERISRAVEAAAGQKP